MTKLMVNEQFFEQLEAIQETGEVNMLDRAGVQRIADELEFSELVVFLEDAKRKEYVELLQAFKQWLEQRSTLSA